MNEINGVPIDEIPDRLQAGDPIIFDAVFHHYWEKLYIAAYSRLRDECQAKEIVQTVFFRLWNKRAGIQIEDLTAYLSAMTRYTVYEHLARESKRRIRELDWFEHTNSGGHSTIVDIENKFLLKFIRELSNELPEKCRLVFVYNKLEDQSLTAVAARMNISRKTAEAHLTKALRFIRLKLENILSFLVLISFFL